MNFLTRKAMAIILVTLFGFILMLPIFAENDPILGDVTEDGRVTAADARCTLRYSCDLLAFTKSQYNRADINEDGKVNSSDARLILKRAAKLDETYTTTIQPAIQSTVATTIPSTTLLSFNGKKAYMTYFSAQEGGGENFNTSLVGRVLIRKNGKIIPNYAKGVDIGNENVVTYYGYNILGTTNRAILPMKSVIEYIVGGKTFYGVVLDNNGDNMAGRSYVTIDHLFCTNAEGRPFIDKYTSNGGYLPICEYRVIGTMDISTGKVIPK
ncbi:MAG: dockerin type I repeat-containing protein [Clostridia bacterium]|nr:dockerin type I repeat-containing protein [Clostridia bacterium]